MPLKNYERSEHPFGALTMRDGEVVENGTPTENNTGNYVAFNFLKFDGRIGVLTYLQESLDKLDANRDATSDDYCPFFKQSADFLIQMPSEIWAIKKKIGTDNKTLTDKLDALALKTHGLGEDLNDYIFLVSRKQDIETRKFGEEAQRIERQKLAAQLSASL